MVVSVTASTTQGSPLEPAALERAKDACVMAIELHEMRKTILDYVESRMSFIAPNVSILVGASTAAKLMGKRFIYVVSIYPLSCCLDRLHFIHYNSVFTLTLQVFPIKA